MNEKQQTATFAEWLKSQLTQITNDPALTKGMARKDKSFDECATLIYEGVKKSGMIGCHTDNNDIISMAIHYFTEDNVTKESMSLADRSHYVGKVSTPATPKATKPTKPTTTKPATPAKATIPIKQKATLPTAKKATLPTAKPTLPPPPPTPQVVDDDEDFDID